MKAAPVEDRVTPAGQRNLQHIRAVLDPAAIGRSLEAQIEIKLKADMSALDFEGVLDTCTRLILRDVHLSGLV